MQMNHTTSHNMTTPPRDSHDHSLHDHSVVTDTHQNHAMSPSGSQHSAHGQDHSLCDMRMWFHADKKDCVVFENWIITTNWQFGLSWAGIFMIAFLRPVLAKLHRSQRILNAIAIACGATQTYDKNEQLKITIGKGSLASYALGFWDAFWYSVIAFIQFMIMLIFMTYNIGLCMAVICGYFWGRFVFETDAGLNCLENASTLCVCRKKEEEYSNEAVVEVSAESPSGDHSGAEEDPTIDAAGERRPLHRIDSHSTAI